MSQALQGAMELGHTFLKTMREKTDRAMKFLEEPEAEQLKEEVDTRLSQLEALIRALRSELSATEKSIQLSKDFLDKYKTQTHWLTETKSLLATPVEPKAELYQKKAQLAKYKVSKTHIFLLSKEDTCTELVMRITNAIIFRESCKPFIMSSASFVPL